MEPIKKVLIIDGKSVGFSKLATSLDMKVLLDNPIVLNKDKHHELVWSIRGVASDNVGGKNMYRIEGGIIDEKTNELISVNLIRTSLDVSGSFDLYVTIEFFEYSYDEMMFYEREEEDMVNRGAEIFLKDKKADQKSLEDLAKEVNDLGEQL